MAQLVTINVAQLVTIKMAKRGPVSNFTAYRYIYICAYMATPYMYTLNQNPPTKVLPSAFWCSTAPDLAYKKGKNGETKTFSTLSKN